MLKQMLEMLLILLAGIVAHIIWQKNSSHNLKLVILKLIIPICWWKIVLDFVMEDVSSLVEACVSFSEITFNHHHLWVELLKGLSGVIQNILFELHLPVFPNLKHLELKSFRHMKHLGWENCRHSGQVLHFLESCQKLKHLYIEDKQAFAWVESRLAPACMLTSLTTIKFSICKWWRCDIPFLEYMLGNAEVLKTVTITWKYSSNIEQETQLRAKLLSLPRASR